MPTIPFRKEDAYFWSSDDGEIFGFTKQSYGDDGSYFGYLLDGNKVLFSCDHDTFEECCKLLQIYIENTLKINYYTG